MKLHYFFILASSILVTLSEAQSAQPLFDPTDFNPNMMGVNPYFTPQSSTKNTSAETPSTTSVQEATQQIVTRCKTSSSDKVKSKLQELISKNKNLDDINTNAVIKQNLTKTLNDFITNDNQCSQIKPSLNGYTFDISTNNNHIYHFRIITNSTKSTITTAHTAATSATKNNSLRTISSDQIKYKDNISQTSPQTTETETETDTDTDTSQITMPDTPQSSQTDSLQMTPPDITAGTPTNSDTTSMYFLLFDNGNYNNKYTGITTAKELETVSNYTWWEDNCARIPGFNTQTTNPELSNVSTIEALGFSLNANSTNYMTPEKVDDILGILLVNQENIVYPMMFDNINSAKDSLSSLANHFHNTPCKGMNIYVLEAQHSPTKNSLTFLVHPGSKTI